VVAGFFFVHALHGWAARGACVGAGGPGFACGGFLAVSGGPITAAA
jgi:hypothetical protein